MFVILRIVQQVCCRPTVFQRIDPISLLLTLLLSRRNFFRRILRLFFALFQYSPNLDIDQCADIQPVGGRANLAQPFADSLSVEHLDLVIQSAHNHGMIARTKVYRIAQHGDNAQPAMGQVFQIK